jgi:uncharacterized protein (DUF849 family)
VSGTPPLVQAALNGSRRREEHPALPLSSWELAQAATEAVEAGAGSIHVHIRDAAGAESLAAPDLARAVDALRTAVPGTPLSVSTGAWIVPDPAQREALVTEWTLLPEAASVNFHEPGAERLAELLLSRGVAVDGGLRDTKAAERLVRSGLGARCRRLILEPPDQSLDAALETVRRVEALLDEAGLSLPRQLHGTDRTTWPLLTEAARRRYEMRIGFEDTLTLPDGSMAATNAVLVTEACWMVR